MKNTLIAIAAVITLMLPAKLNAQSAKDNPNVTKSLDIARNMMLAISGLADDFKKYKGDYIMKDKSDNSYYSVKELNLGTDLQYVIVKPSGTTVIAAIYKGKDADDKTTVALAFAAFTAGITTLIDKKEFSVVRDESAGDNSLKYFFKLNDTKIASFDYDVKGNEATMLIAVQ